ncbi:MAG TPA: lysylphosphatidylglycerol synthase transmembrane domain-containing protein [Candidatus Polarisedimenticolaceae bacterium]|nr:lysylphosphatidylglycerol synthase transmembrane domain-containing protein [Candidatus Polarisedimenticolaceae bacterium]
MAKLAAKYALGLLLAAFLMWLVLRGADPRALWAQIARASIVGLLACGAINASHNMFRVWRWRALLHPVRPAVPFRPMFDAVILGYLVTWTVPGRLGELVRPALLSGRERIPLAPCLGSVLADRLVDGLAILLLFAVGLSITPLSGEAASVAHTLRLGSLLMVALISIPLIGLLAVSRARQRLEAWWSASASGPRRWLARAVVAFSAGTDALKQPRLLLRVVVHSLAAWLTIALGLWIGVRSCGAPISFGAMLVILPALALGVALPTPGGAGGFHAAMTFGLHALFGVDRATAVGTGLLVHASVVIPVIALGAAILAAEHIPLRHLVEAARQLRDLGAAPGEGGPTP